MPGITIRSLSTGQLRQPEHMLSQYGTLYSSIRRIIAGSRTALEQITMSVPAIVSEDSSCYWSATTGTSEQKQTAVVAPGRTIRYVSTGHRVACA
eukprot:3747133-Rhodomonas_salina.9